MKIFIFLLSVLLLSLISTVKTDDSYYTAGVVEFKPQVGGMNSSQLIDEHLKAYLNILNSDEAIDTDIIVFPEGTLNNAFNLTYVPSVKDNIVPCTTNPQQQYADFLVQISCAARRLRKYVVINLTEKENCPSTPEDLRPCASNKLNIFNTNVVFDREGRVVSRYRKVHVYVENKNTTLKPEYATFVTDFGVRFGHFICFDILFYTPAQQLVDRFNVTDFIFTSLFYSELPFLTAVQLQHGWAWGNNVNLLAAGASYPEWGMTGSGIYAGEFGDLVSVMVSEVGERKLYKARVPKKGSKYQPQNTNPPIKTPHNVTKLRLLKDPQIEDYNSVILDISSEEKYIKRYLCDGDVCCTFEVNAKIVNDSLEESLRFRVGIYDGRRTYEKEEWSDIKVCALYACANSELSSCGEPVVTNNVLFKSISIKGKFPKGNKLLIMPSILDDQLYPLNRSDIMWSSRKPYQVYEVDLKLLREHTNIMTFGVYGQYYEKSAAVSTSAATHILIITFLLLNLLGFMNS